MVDVYVQHPAGTKRTEVQRGVVDVHGHLVVAAGVEVDHIVLGGKESAAQLRHRANLGVRVCIAGQNQHPVPPVEPFEDRQPLPELVQPRGFIREIRHDLGVQRIARRGPDRDWGASAGQVVHVRLHLLGPARLYRLGRRNCTEHAGGATLLQGGAPGLQNGCFYPSNLVGRGDEARRPREAARVARLAAVAHQNGHRRKLGCRCRTPPLGGRPNREFLIPTGSRRPVNAATHSPKMTTVIIQLDDIVAGRNQSGHQGAVVVPGGLDPAPRPLREAQQPPPAGLPEPALPAH